MAESTRTLLYVEDNADDRALMSRAVRQQHPWISLQCVQHGVSALALLTAAGEHGTPCLPDVVLLGFGAARRLGVDTLRAVAAEPLWSSVPVVALVSSSQLADCELVRRLGARDCIVRPRSQPELHLVLRYLTERWLQPPPEFGMTGS